MGTVFARDGEDPSRVTRILRIGRDEVAVDEYGSRDGPALVLLHGFPDSRLVGELLDEPAGRLGVRIICPDRPGIGRSTGRLRSLLDYPDRLAALADRLGLDRFALVGLSGGAPYALACAYRIPQRLTTVTLLAGLGPAGSGWSRMPAAQRLGIHVGRRSLLLTQLVLGGTGFLARHAPRLFLRLVRLELSPADRPALEGAAGDNFLRSYAEAFRRGAGGIRNDFRLLFSPWGFRPEDVEIPVLIEHGGADRTVPPETARDLAARIPNASLHVHPHLGHLSLLRACGETLLATAVADAGARAS